MRDLKEKAIDIKGKKYVLVSDRILAFNEEYANGSINTVLITQPLDQTVIIKALVMPDTDKPGRFFTGYSQAVIGDGYINKAAALENAETSAVGRALAFMGIGVIDSVASVDEIKKTSYVHGAEATTAKTYPKYVKVADRYPSRKAEYNIEPDTADGSPFASSPRK